MVEDLSSGLPRTNPACANLRTVDVFSVVGSFPPFSDEEKRRPEIRLLFVG